MYSVLTCPWASCENSPWKCSTDTGPSSFLSSKLARVSVSHPLRSKAFIYHRWASGLPKRQWRHELTNTSKQSRTKSTTPLQIDSFTSNRSKQHMLLSYYQFTVYECTYECISHLHHTRRRIDDESTLVVQLDMSVFFNCHSWHLMATLHLLIPPTH